MRRLLPLFIALVGLVVAVGAPPAGAQIEFLQVTTDYPAVAAEAGDTVDFDLDVMAADRREVSLAVVDAPTGWETTFRGGGFVIGGVTADPDSPPRVELEVSIPHDTEPGQHNLVVEAATPSESDSLELAIVVTDRPIGGISMSTDFAVLRGRPSDTFRYDLDVSNQTPAEITLGFDVLGPAGWTLTAGPSSETRASTVTIAPGESEKVRVEAEPLNSTSAGSYEILVRASGGGQTGELALTVEVTGQASIDLLSLDGRLDLTGTAGEATITTVFVVNDGSAPLEDVRLSADEPAEWSVEFSEEEIELIDAGEIREIEVTIHPAGDAIAGDYSLDIRARGNGETAELEYRFTVETSQLWGAVGIGVIVAALSGLFGVFRTFGRR